MTTNVSNPPDITTEPESPIPAPASETVNHEIPHQTFVSQALAPLEPRTLTELKGVAEVFAASGLFQDVQSMSRAFVKIMAGREMGFGAYASMRGIHIIKDQTCVGANLMAAAIKRHEKYDYQIVALTEARCEIEFFEHGASKGLSIFTMDDAAIAELTRPGSVWIKVPRNMLFARALSNGQRWYCPDVFAQPVYTPEEMGADVDEDGNMIIEDDFEYVAPKPETPAQAKPDRRIDTNPLTPPKKKSNGPDPNIPWPDVIQDYGQKEWGVYWEYAHNTLDLTDEEVHDALEVESVKEFEGTREEHNTRLLEASKRKKTGQSATPEQPAQPKGKGKPFYRPEKKPKIAPFKGVHLPDDEHEGYIAVSRIVATRKPGQSPVITVYALDDSFNEDPIPIITQMIPAGDVKELLENPDLTFPVNKETVIYQHKNNGTGLTIEWERDDKGVVTIASALLIQ